MPTLLGILIIITSSGAAIMQPFQTDKPTTCVVRDTETLAYCYQADVPIKGTGGYTTKRIKVQVDFGRSK